MSIITIEHAQSQLVQLIDEATAGAEIVITRNQTPVAKLRVYPILHQKPRQPGTLKGTVLYMAPDFNTPLEEFKEYMP